MHTYNPVHTSLRTSQDSKCTHPLQKACSKLSCFSCDDKAFSRHQHFYLCELSIEVHKLLNSFWLRPRKGCVWLISFVYVQIAGNLVVSCRLHEIGTRFFIKCQVPSSIIEGFLQYQRIVPSNIFFVSVKKRGERLYGFIDNNVDPLIKRCWSISMKKKKDSHPQIRRREC